jgi:hypothetical protein
MAWPIGFLIAAFGASLEEVFYWRELRTKLSVAKYKVMLTSRTYWMITVSSIGASAAGSLIWYFGQNPAPKDLMLAGAAFPLLFKRAVATFSNRRVLGAKRPTSARLILATYFQTYSENG